MNLRNSIRAFTSFILLNSFQRLYYSAGTTFWLKATESSLSIGGTRENEMFEFPASGSSNRTDQKTLETVVTLMELRLSKNKACLLSDFSSLYSQVLFEIFLGFATFFLFLLDSRDIIFKKSSSLDSVEIAKCIFSLTTEAEGAWKCVRGSSFVFST